MQVQKKKPFVVDGPYTISSREGASGQQYCIRHQARSIDDLKQIGVIPRFIDIDAVKRAVEKVAQPTFYTARAERWLQDELDQIRSREQAMTHRTEAFNRARLDRFAMQIQVEGVVEALGSRVALPIRKSVATRAIDLVQTGSYSVTAFHMDRDIEVRDLLIFDVDIDMCKVGDLRVRDGGMIESRAPYFILHARSFGGPWRSAGTSGVSGADGKQGTPGAQGAKGRAAVCRDFLHTDQVPTNGGPGGNGGNGGDGVDGGAGSDGHGFESHLEVLLPNMVVDTSGGRGGDGGNGGKGGAGGKGGTGGDGKGCEPSGVGGKGGNGGQGGNGGNGGKSGNGGDIFIYYVSDQSAGSPPVLIASSGGQGQGGEPGLGGDPGSAGDPGPESKYGKARWDPGAPKGPGAVGANGQKGAPGQPGRNGATVLEQVPLV